MSEPLLKVFVWWKLILKAGGFFSGSQSFLFKNLQSALFFGKITLSKIIPVIYFTTCFCFILCLMVWYGFQSHCNPLKTPLRPGSNLLWFLILWPYKVKQLNLWTWFRSSFLCLRLRQKFKNQINRSHFYKWHANDWSPESLLYPENRLQQSKHGLTKYNTGLNCTKPELNQD